MYPSRVRLLDRLIAKGIPLRLYGGGFPRWIGETPARAVHTGRYVAREEKARVFRSAAGVLNTMHPSEVNGVNARLFEAAGCGAAVLTEFRPTVPELFAVGKEILVFHDFDDLVEQAIRLLSERGLTAQLGDAARSALIATTPMICASPPSWRSSRDRSARRLLLGPLAPLGPSRCCYYPRPFTLCAVSSRVKSETAADSEHCLFKAGCGVAEAVAGGMLPHPATGLGVIGQR